MSKVLWKIGKTLFLATASNNFGGKAGFPGEAHLPIIICNNHQDTRALSYQNTIFDVKIECRQ